MKFLLFLSVTFLTFSSYAFSKNSWYVEPHLGFVAGSFEQGYSAHGTHTGTGITLDTDDNYADGTVSGLSFGAKLGYHWNNFFLAGDLRYDIGTYDLLVFDGNDSTVAYDSVGTSVGAVLGYRFDMGLGLWFGFSGESLIITDDSDNKDTYGGTGVKYGIGYKWTNWAFNIEYSDRTYSEVDGHKFPYTTTVSGVTITSEELKTSTILFSISRYFSF